VQIFHTGFFTTKYTTYWNYLSRQACTVGRHIRNGKKNANRVVFSSAILQHGNGFTQQPAKQQDGGEYGSLYALSNGHDRPVPTSETETPRDLNREKEF
jgi:hypothetical protein